MAEKIRIKDIAERAGVSVGTVDRVLHDRPNVSKPARDKVEKALKEMNYQPNVYASALAYNKSYTFYLLIPKHESEAYWEEIEEGAKKCEDTRRDFHIDVEIRFYERSNEESFREEGNKILEASPEGVIVVPSSLDVTREFTEALHHKSIPFILLDSYMHVHPGHPRRKNGHPCHCANGDPHSGYIGHCLTAPPPHQEERSHGPQIGVEHGG